VNGKGFLNMPAMSRTKQEKSKKLNLIVEDMCAIKYFCIKVGVFNIRRNGNENCLLISNFNSDLMPRLVFW
jgi:hypothetical protein